MKLYRIMNHVKTKVPEKEPMDQESINQMRCMARQIARKRNYVWAKKIAAAVIVIFAAGGVSVGAKVGNGADTILNYFQSALGGKETKKDFQPVNKDEKIVQSKNHDILVSVQKTVSVRGMLYALIQVELPENRMVEEDQTFQYIKVLTGAKNDAKEKERPEDAKDRLIQIRREKNKGWFICQMERENYNFHQQRISIELEGFSDTHTTPAKLIYENPKGKWNLTWTEKNGSGGIKEVQIEKEYTIDGEKTMIHSLTMTPLYLRIYSGEKGNGKNPGNLLQCVLKLKDGTAKKVNISYVDEAKKDQYAFYHADFEEVINPEQILAIVLNGQEIEIK